MVNFVVLELEREYLDENSFLGDLLWGVLDVLVCQIVICFEGKNNWFFVFFISMVLVVYWFLDVVVDLQEELQDWVKKICEVVQIVDVRFIEGKIMEWRKKIVLEFFEFVVYCWFVFFDEEKIGIECVCYWDMLFFLEIKVEKYVNKVKGKKFFQYN